MQTPAIGSADATTTSTSAAERPPRVLSIQSHVVSGYVGNKAAVFPLQVSGLRAAGSRLSSMRGLQDPASEVSTHHSRYRLLKPIAAPAEVSALLWTTESGAVCCLPSKQLPAVRRLLRRVTDKA